MDDNAMDPDWARLMGLYLRFGDDGDQVAGSPESWQQAGAAQMIQDPHGMGYSGWPLQNGTETPEETTKRLGMAHMLLNQDDGASQSSDWPAVGSSSPDLGPFSPWKPSGSSRVVYIPGADDGTGGQMVVANGWGQVVGVYPAGNRVDSHANAEQWPPGTYDFLRHTQHPEDANPNMRYGRYGNFIFDSDFPWCLDRNGSKNCGIHAGRVCVLDPSGKNIGGPDFYTNGCIRTTEDGTGALQYLQQNGSPLSTLTVMPRMSYPVGADPVQMLFPRSNMTPIAPPLPPLPTHASPCFISAKRHANAAPGAPPGITKPNGSP